MTKEAIQQIARIALAPLFAEPDVDHLVQSIDLKRLRNQLAGLGLAEPAISDLDVARLYFSGRCAALSPNAFFDESWYIEHYDDVRECVRAGTLLSGFAHFIKAGITDGRWPNQTLHATAQSCGTPSAPATVVPREIYLALNPGAMAFLDAFPFLDAEDHYNLYGRFLGYALAPSDQAVCLSPALNIMQTEFDPAYYAATYLSSRQKGVGFADPFDHYIKRGMRAGHSPNAWFQEDWYCAFYEEIRDAVAEGLLPCGFYHYIIAGRGEGRLPKFELTAALEARMPGVTDPSLLPHTDTLAARLAGLTTLPAVSEGPTGDGRIWFLLPGMNPDIMYGGYRAVLEIICALVEERYSVGIVCLDEAPNTPYFFWRESCARTKEALSAIPILSKAKFTAGEIGRRDLFIAYTVWDLKACAQLAARTDNKIPFLLAQEYEPIFYENGSRRALCEAAYQIEHYPIINSHFLLSYLKDQRLGVFGRSLCPREFVQYAVFEHRIASLPRQSAASMAARKSRVLAIYGRPEAHAGRNLFEMLLIALRNLCAREVFSSEWSFIGLGALSQLHPVALGGEHQLRLLPKMEQSVYAELMAELDIGVSLMYAPHPSVMPFEFATTGALVVTNTYSNRSSKTLTDISSNIVPCDVSIDSLEAAIRTALSRVEDFAEREKNALQPKARSWREIFTKDFLDNIFADHVHEPKSEIIVEFPLPAERQARSGDSSDSPRAGEGRHSRKLA